MVLLLLAAAGCCGMSGTGRCLQSSTIEAVAARGDDAQLRTWLGDERSWVREEAALAVGRQERRSLSPDVQARLLDRAERAWVRSAAARALGVLGTTDPETLAQVALAPGTPAEVKIAVIEALCASHPKQAPTLLASLVGDADVLVSAAAQRQVNRKCDLQTE